MQNILIHIELNDQQALAFAQFLKRVGYHNYRPLAISQEETYAMIEAGERIRDALAEHGYAPR